MSGENEKARAGLIRPPIQRPRGHQVAALCWRPCKGEIQVLLITSRRSGRWIIPKGWPIPGKDDAQSAVTEAWEEAGVRAEAAPVGPIGRFAYVKQPDNAQNGVPVTLEADVYLIRVGDLARRYPEVGQRKRCWVTPRKAAVLVEEPRLQGILRTM